MQTIMTNELFTRDPENPILSAGTEWWEEKGVLNPGVAAVNGGVVMVYRARGADGLSRLGVTWSDDGRRFARRQFLHEAARDDALARLGLEDPRLTPLEGDLWVIYTKASVDPVGTLQSTWETAPFRLRVALARVQDGERIGEERPLLADVQAKDGVLFPRRIHGLYYALVRIYPSMQITSSPDLRSWSAPRTLMQPRPGTWEAERIGAGPPPIETRWGWLLIYHANEYYERDGNKRYYRAGLAVLDKDDPTRVLYRHPDPILVPTTEHETGGSVGNVVFPSGLLARDGLYYLYYGGGDSTISLATAPVAVLDEFLERALG